jgi:WD40 repeat protein
VHIVLSSHTHPPPPPLAPLPPPAPLQCCSLSWNLQQQDQFLSSSWDDTIKLHSLAAPASLATFRGHKYCVYQVAW